MGKIIIVRESGLEEIVFEEDGPKLIFGTSNALSQKEERDSIGKALLKTGFEVYATNVLWPYGSYILNNGLALPASEFGTLGDGGYYVFGDGFVLVSTAIKECLEQRLRDSEHFRTFFSGKEIIFIPPYSRSIEGIEGSKLKPWHIDVTINYVPGERLLSVSKGHYHEEKELFEELRKRFGVCIKMNTVAKFYPNNFFVVQYNGEVYVIANKLNNPSSGNTNGFKVIETERDIINLPGKFGGSVQCAANKSPTTKLWDALGIEYRRWGVNPQQAKYAPR